VIARRLNEHIRFDQVRHGGVCDTGNGGN